MQTPPLPGARAARSQIFDVRGLHYHAHVWGEADAAPAAPPPLVLLHGWMDVGASFQFVVDALDALDSLAMPAAPGSAAAERRIVAPDWRGFGRTEAPGATDAYWFADYLGDLDTLLDLLSPGRPVDLLGHSMGGNVAMVYAGVRPDRVRRLVNLEGFGLPDSPPAQAPQRYAAWLDDLKQPQRLSDYASLADVARRLRRNNPRLSAERADWLAAHWSRPDAASGRWVIQGDPAHKRSHPVPYHAADVTACWARIAAPVLWIEGRQTDVAKYWGDRYPRAEFEERLQAVPRIEHIVLDDAGHMLHHDQPAQVAAHVARFLAG